MYKVYVGCLPASCTESQLKQFFSPFGKISHVKLGRKAGNKFCSGNGSFYCHVQTAFDKIVATRTFLFNDRVIYCDKLLSGQELLHKNKELGERRVFLSNLPDSASDLDIEYALSYFGQVQTGYRIKSLLNEIRPYGFVTYFDSQSASHAISEGEIFIHSQLATISPFHKKEKKNALLNPQSLVSLESRCKNQSGFVIPANARLLTPINEFSARRREAPYFLQPRVARAAPADLKPTSTRYHSLRPSLPHGSADIRLNLFPGCHWRSPATELIQTRQNYSSAPADSKTS